MGVKNVTSPSVVLGLTSSSNDRQRGQGTITVGRKAPNFGKRIKHAHFLKISAWPGTQRKFKMALMVESDIPEGP